jgi:DNA invertase Pin-like site-specific DNA recombinase
MSPRKQLTLDLYCRISKDYDGTLRSVEDQEVQGREEVARAGHLVGAVFRDHALSAWDPKVERPEFNELMERLESGAADGVWVRNLDRFTRKVREGERLLEAAKAGALVLSSDSNYDLTTARGVRSFREDMVDAAYESDRISERSTRGKRNKARRGKSNASYRGFARDGFLPNPVGWERGDPRVPVSREQLRREQEAVRDAAARLLSGESLHQVAKSWNDAGLLTVKGARWNGADVRQLLTSPTLAGILTHKGEVVGTLEGEHALDESTWRRLQTHFASRKRGRPASSYLLSALLRCGKCGGRLYGRPLAHRQPYPDGETRRQYWCMPRLKEGGGCGQLVIDQRFADEAVTEVVLEVLGDPRHADRLARRAVKMQEARQELSSELHRLEEDAKGIASKTATRGFAWVEAAMEPIDARMAELRAQLDALEEPDESAAVDAAYSWEGASLEQRRAMVKRAFPRGITVRAATSRGKASLTADRFDFGGDLGGDRGGDQVVA